MSGMKQPIPMNKEPITKHNLDKYFTSLVPELEIIVKGICYKKFKNYDPFVVINEAYIHAIQNIESIHSEHQAERLIKNYIKQNIVWYNSKINKLERVNDNLSDTPYIKELDEDDDLEAKIEIELWLTERKVILQMYRKQLKDMEKRRLFDAYFLEGIQTGLALAIYFNTNKDYASKRIRELKAEIRHFYNEELKNNYSTDNQ